MADVELGASSASVSYGLINLKKLLEWSGTITSTSVLTGVIPCEQPINGQIDGQAMILLPNLKVIIGEPNIDKVFHVPRTGNHPYKDWHRVMNVQLDESTYNAANLVYVSVPWTYGMNTDFSDVRFAYGQNALDFSIISTTTSNLAVIIDLPYQYVPEIQCYFDNPNELVTTGLSSTAYTSRFSFIDTFSSNPSATYWETGCSAIPLSSYTSSAGNMIVKQVKLSYSYFPGYLLTTTDFTRDTTVICVYKPTCQDVEFGFYGSPDSYMNVTYGYIGGANGTLCGHYYNYDNITSGAAIVSSLNKQAYTDIYHVYAGKMHKAMVGNTYTQFDHYIDNTCIYKHLVAGASNGVCPFSIFMHQYPTDDTIAANNVLYIDTVIAATSMHVGICDTSEINPYYTGIPVLQEYRPSGPIISNISVIPSSTQYISSDIDTITYTVSFDLDDNALLRPASNLTVSMTEGLYYSDITGASDNHIDVTIVVTGGTASGTHDIIVAGSNAFGDVTYTIPIDIELKTLIPAELIVVKYPKRLSGINEYGVPEFDGILMTGQYSFTYIDENGRVIIKTDYGKTGSPLVYRVAKRIITFLHTYIWGALV